MSSMFRMFSTARRPLPESSTDNVGETDVKDVERTTSGALPPEEEAAVVAAAAAASEASQAAEAVERKAALMRLASSGWPGDYPDGERQAPSGPPTPNIFGKDDEAEDMATKAALIRKSSQRGESMLSAAVAAATSSDLDHVAEDSNPFADPFAIADPVWSTVRDEAQAMLAEEPLLADAVQSTILGSQTFEMAVATRVAADLAGAKLNEDALRKEMTKVFLEELDHKQRPLARVIRADLSIIKRRDPACDGLAQAMLFFKGFAALEAHRFAHAMWKAGRRSLALHIQSTCSKLYCVDIHPAARIGLGLLMDHASGIVIGETAVIGDFCTLFHGVTLGGTGKDGAGDRHPKLCDGVLVGAGAQILGPIFIGCGAKIGSGSVVLRSLPPLSTAVGSPAKVVGRTLDAEGQILGKTTPDMALNNVDWLADFTEMKSLWTDAMRVGHAVGNDALEKVQEDPLVEARKLTTPQRKDSAHDSGILARIGVDEFRKRVEPLGLNVEDVDAFFFLLEEHGVCLTEEELERGMVAFHVIKAGIIGDGYPESLGEDYLNRMTLKRMALARIAGEEYHGELNALDEDVSDAFGVHQGDEDGHDHFDETDNHQEDKLPSSVGATVTDEPESDIDEIKPVR